jgi:hypothetical protein
MIFNPFENTATLPSDNVFVAQTFVEDVYVVNSFISRRHSFIWGARGSGKSTLLKYFEPFCQTNEYKDWDTFIQSDNCFIGIYCPLARGMFDESKFTRLDDYIKEVLPKHLLNMLISKKLINTFIEISKNVDCIKCLGSDKEAIEDFCLMIGANDDMKSGIGRDLGFLSYVDKFLDMELNRINNYIQRSPKIEMKFNCCLTDYHDYILPFVKLIKKMYNICFPIYFMFDDMGYAPENIQKYLNTWIANRDNTDIVVKIASNPYFYSCFLAEDGYAIEKTHDYIEINLDYVKTMDRQIFRKNVIEIIKKRLSLSEMKQKNPEVLFPEDTEHKKLLEIAKNKSVELASDNKNIIDVNRFVNRKTISELHKLLSERKRIRSYAGLENLINLASGNYRNFLRLADAVLKYVLEESHLNLCELDFINPKDQQSAVTAFSENEFQKIRGYRTDIRTEVFEGAYTLIDSMGEIFKYRLKDGSFEECAITAFSIKDYNNLDELHKDIIKYALVNGLFICRSVRSKNGLGRVEIYELNKLFIPCFNLEPTAFSGHIIFFSEEIKQAMKNKNIFVNNYKRKNKNKDKDGQFYQIQFSDYIEE